MNTVKHCLHCGQWFVPKGADDLLCKNCNGSDMGRVIMWWWVAFAGAIIGILIFALL